MTSVGQLRQMKPTDRARYIATLPAESRLRLAHLATLGAQKAAAQQEEYIAVARDLTAEPAEPEHIPVHTLRYHDCAGHFWLECSIDGGPWKRVPSSYGTDTEETVCGTPNAGRVASSGREPKWKDQT